MPPDLKELELSALYDLLADYTARYTQIMRWGSLSDNLKEYQDSILELHSEIDFRITQIDTGVQPLFMGQLLTKGE
jgi:hypothetical protein